MLPIGDSGGGATQSSRAVPAMVTATTTNVTTMEMEPRSTRIRLAVHPTGQESRKRAGILLAKKDGGSDRTRSRTEEDPGDSPMRAASRCSPDLERPLWSLSSAAPAAPEEEGVESLLVVAARRGLMPARRGLIPARPGEKWIAGGGVDRHREGGCRQGRATDDL